MRYQICCIRLKNWQLIPWYAWYFRDFGDVYDVQKFILSLNGTVNIAYHQPPELSAGKLPTVRVPSVISEAYVTANLEPLFRKKGNLKIKMYFPTPNMTKVEGTKYMNSILCMVVFEALQLQAGLQEFIDSVLEKLKILSPESHGRFIAVDWRAQMLGTKWCQGTAANGKKSCFSAQEVGQFLNKTGFGKNTTIYLTQDGWHNSLDALAYIFPNAYTKVRPFITHGLLLIYWMPFYQVHFGVIFQIERLSIHVL